MTPLEFLAVVLPSPDHGYYCVAELSTRKKEHRFSPALEELEEHVTRWDTADYDVYFALATFENSDTREAVNAQYLRSLFVDMDGYETKKAAAEAITTFMDRVGLDLLGTPYIVGSGGGLHVYWPFTEDVAVDRWKPLAEGLKRLCKQEGLKIDMTVTADAARVLRVPGTRNHKKKYGTPKPVRILTEGDTFAFEDLESLIISQLKTQVLPMPTPTLRLEGVRPTSVSAVSTIAPLFQNSITKFRTIYKKTQAGTGCAQLSNFVENAAEDGMEPQWRAWLSIAQKCEDGDKAVIWLSGLHPYDTDRMNQKLAGIKGPYPCVKFDSENPGVCDNCSHRGKITNPLALGRELDLVTEPVVMEVAVPAQMPIKVLRPEPPHGYAYGKNGGVFMEKDSVDDQGNVIKKQIMLCQYDLFPVDILNFNGVHEVHLRAIRSGRIQDITVAQESIASKDTTIKTLASQNVMAAFGSGNDKNLYEYVRACVEKLSVERAPIALPTSYGWQDDGSFVFAGRIYSKNKEPISVPMSGLENITSNTQPTGTLENWQKVVQLLIRRRLWDHLAVVLLGAGAPLMKFTKLYGMTIHCASRNSGTGKSLALDTAAAIWGHPVHYRTGSGTSAVAMQQRLGLLRSLPLVTDEITTNNRKDFEWFPAFLFSMSEGRGKERMESGSNKERLNLSTWATLAIMSSNRNAVDYLAGERQHSSEGELRRLLEFSIDQKLQWTDDEIEVIKSLQDNYALAGVELSQYFVDNMEYIKKLVDDTTRQMYKHYNAPRDERFWMAAIACGVVAGVLFNGKHTNLAEIPMQEIMVAYGRAVETMRTSIHGGSVNAEDVLNSYIQENQGKFVVVKYGERSGLLAHFQDGTEVGRNTARQEVMGRVEHGHTAGYIDFYIEERLLRAHCSTMSYSYQNFKQEIQELFQIRYQKKKDLLAKTDGPTMRVAAIQISRRVDEDDAPLTQD
jgi:hypothetical protein